LGSSPLVDPPGAAIYPLYVSDFHERTMPIYAYRCDACGHGRDVLQKMSDSPLTDCPSCGTAGTFKKQLTAAGFQLKGSGWYVTDFRGGSGGTSAAASAPASAPAADAAPAAASSGATASAAAPAAAGGCAGSCACH
jgi:putative FmdB family regulatory protein